MKRLLLFLITLVAALAVPSNDDARSSAEKWLSLVDSEKYADSWTESGSQFRSHVTQEKWVEMAKSVRSPLGLLTSRSLLNVANAKSLPGAPDGDYSIVRFQSAFKNKSEAIETVVLLLEESKLKTVGYFIK